MNENSSKRTRRTRRTNEEIQNDIKEAAIECILESGFDHVMLKDILKKAHVEPVIFYNRYADLDDCLEELAKEGEYWMPEFALKACSIRSTKEQYDALLCGLLDALKDKSIMLELLRWEIAHENKTTIRTARSREIYTLPLTHNYAMQFADSDIDIVAFSALLIGGIYYLSLHRKMSNFSGIDMGQEEGIERVRKTLLKVSDIMFDRIETRKKKEQAAQELREKGLDDEFIKNLLARF
ncbi:MAG: TetR/AcrR family transcriptional regulator [Bacteroidaceae bacterium]|nr:TetR/AcrR family transcriptional regulator [Bacteroidaceae bacterium]